MNEKYFLKLIKDFFVTNKKITIQYFFFVIAYSPIEVFLFAYILGKFYNKISLNKKKDFMKFIVLIIFLFTLGNIFRLLKLKYEKKLIPDFLYFFRKNLFENILLSLKTDFHEANIGKILTSFINIPNSFNTLIYNFFGIIIPRLLSSIFIIIFLLVLDLKIGLVSVVVFTILSIIIYILEKNCSKMCYRKIKQFERSNQEIEDVLKNSFSVLVSSNTSKEIKNIDVYEKYYKKKYFDSMNCTIKYNIIFCIVLILYLSFMIFFVLKSKLSNSNKISSLIFTTYLVWIYTSFYDLIPSVINEYVFTKNSLKLFNNLKSEKNKKKIKLNGQIKLENITFKYKNKTIFENLNMLIKPNNKIIIIGKSGTGKSSLLKVLLGFYKISKGKIIYNNSSLYNLNIDNLRSQITLCDQYPKLFDNSVLYNIKYSTNKTDNDVIEFIKKNKINNIQKIIKMKSIGINGYKISGGQRQMINIMKCFLKDSKIIFMDEPSSSLDDYHFNILNKLIDNNKNKTFIIISHDKRINKLKNFNTYKLVNKKLKKVINNINT